MNTAPAATTAATISATNPAKPAAPPRVKVLPQGFVIDHPDPARGEQLMADALGVTDREAMDGILRQLVRASAVGDRPDEVNLALMISMVNSIGPRDAIEAMLVAQMVAIHVMAMRCAQHLATADDPLRRDSASRALGRLARTFPAQIDALNRHRSQSEAKITVQNVSVADGGNAIVGNVTQHRNVIVKEKGAASVARKTGRASESERGSDGAEAEGKAQA